jgi:hypothetical protein
MQDGVEKLQQDQLVFAAMVAEMAAYLRSDVLFWPLGDRPVLTLGGCLLRRERLLALRDLLPKAEQTAVTQTESQLHAIFAERIVRTEQKAVVEINARLRQWREFLQDVGQPDRPVGVNFATAVEPRLMLAALFNLLGQRPYELDPALLKRAEGLDKQLRRRWEPGDFIFPAAWQPAYPQTAYWWLYGRPQYA